MVPLFLSGINCVDFSAFSYLLFYLPSRAQKIASDIILLLSSWSWGKINRSGFYDVCAHCSLSPFSFLFFMCLLCLPYPCFHKYLPLGIWFLISALEWAGMGEFPFSSNSVRNINAQYKTDMPDPRLPSSAFLLPCLTRFQKLNGFFFDLKINFWTKRNMATQGPNLCCFTAWL